MNNLKQSYKKILKYYQISLEINLYLTKEKTKNI